MCACVGHGVASLWRLGSFNPVGGAFPWERPRCIGGRVGGFPAVRHRVPRGHDHPKHKRHRPEVPSLWKCPAQSRAGCRRFYFSLTWREGRGGRETSACVAGAEPRTRPDAACPHAGRVPMTRCPAPALPAGPQGVGRGAGVAGSSSCSLERAKPGPALRPRGAAGVQRG